MLIILFSLIAVGIWIYVAVAAVMLFAIAIALVIFGYSERKKHKRMGVKKKYPVVMMTIGGVVLGIFLLLILYGFAVMLADAIRQIYGQIQ